MGRRMSRRAGKAPSTSSIPTKTVPTSAATVRARIGHSGSLRAPSLRSRFARKCAITVMVQIQVTARTAVTPSMVEMEAAACACATTPRSFLLVEAPVHRITESILLLLQHPREDTVRTCLNFGVLQAHVSEAMGIGIITAPGRVLDSCPRKSLVDAMPSNMTASVQTFQHSCSFTTHTRLHRVHHQSGASLPFSMQSAA